LSYLFFKKEFVTYITEKEGKKGHNKKDIHYFLRYGNPQTDFAKSPCKIKKRIKAPVSNAASPMP